MTEDIRLENLRIELGEKPANQTAVARIMARYLTGGDFEGYIREAAAEAAALGNKSNE